MERYFIVTEDSGLHKEYCNSKRGAEFVCNNVIDFLISHGIESTTFGWLNKYLFIKPTDQDRANFHGALCAPNKEGYCKFKTNSKIAKDWKALLNANNIKRTNKPFVIPYFNNWTEQMKSRVFDVDGVIYCSFENQGEVACPEGMTEIPGSQFFKAIEDEKAKRSAGIAVL